MSLTPQQVSKRVSKAKAKFLEVEIRLLEKDMKRLKQAGYKMTVETDYAPENVLHLECELTEYKMELELIREVKF